VWVWKLVSHKREERKRQRDVKTVLKKTFQPKKTEVTVGCRTLHSDAIHDLYCSPPYIIRMTKSSRLRYAARLGKKCVQSFDGELEGRRPLGRTSRRLEHNTVIDVKERGLGLVTSVHPFVCSRGTTRLPLHGLSWDFILGTSTKYFETFQFWLMSDEITTRHKYLRRLRQKYKKYNSNKSPTRCNNFPVYYPDVYLQLNKFRAFSLPSSGAQWLQWQPLVLPSYRGDSCAVQSLSSWW